MLPENGHHGGLLYLQQQPDSWAAFFAPMRRSRKRTMDLSPSNKQMSLDFLIVCKHQEQTIRGMR
jgi:hypothetical protein